MIRASAAVAHPWLCDVMGHLNTRHYVGMFDDANMILIARLGYSFRDAQTSPVGWADIRNEVDYLAEVPAGLVVEIYSAVVKLGSKSITLLSEMRCAESGKTHARMTAVMVYFDRREKKSLPLTDEIRAAATALMT